jgi:hypothetical protein
LRISRTTTYGGLLKITPSRVPFNHETFKCFWINHLESVLQLRGKREKNWREGERDASKADKQEKLHKEKSRELKSQKQTFFYSISP